MAAEAPSAAWPVAGAKERRRGQHADLLQEAEAAACGCSWSGRLLLHLQLEFPAAGSFSGWAGDRLEIFARAALESVSGESCAPSAAGDASTRHAIAVQAWDRLPVQ